MAKPDLIQLTIFEDGATDLPIGGLARSLVTHAVGDQIDLSARYSSGRERTLRLIVYDVWDTSVSSIPVLVPDELPEPALRRRLSIHKEHENSISFFCDDALARQLAQYGKVETPSDTNKNYRYILPDGRYEYSDILAMLKYWEEQPAEE